MKTKEMLRKLTGAGYPTKLVASQSGVSYMKLFRYCRGEAKMTPDEKSRIWRFAILQPVIADALNIEMQEVGE